MLTKLVCPDCRVEIELSAATARCPQCARVYPYCNGILSFLTSMERFNEGEFEDKQKNAWNDSAQMRLKVRGNRLLSFLNKLRIKFSFSGRRDRLFYNEMKDGDKNRLILDLGCGGGRHYFCDYGKVIGVDPVLELLPMAKSLYAEVYHAGGYALPFADNTFDYLVSSDVLGHIPFDKKDLIFSEMHRVLKKGGRVVHLIETDAVNVWYRYAKKNPALFQKYFIDLPGHVGLELPSALRSRFLKHGFKEVLFKKFWGNLMEIGALGVLFNNEAKDRSIVMRIMVAISKLLSRSLLVREVLHLFMEPLGILDDHLTPIDHGMCMLVVFEK